MAAHAHCFEGGDLLAVLLTDEDASRTSTSTVAVDGAATVLAPTVGNADAFCGANGTLGFDNWNSTQLVNDLLAESAPMVVFRQGFVSMNPAMKEVERLILKRDLEHPGDPVLTWAMGNVVAARDPAGNVKPDKAKSTNKIDPAVASIMALGRLMVHADDGGGFGIEVL